MDRQMGEQQNLCAKMATVVLAVTVLLSNFITETSGSTFGDGQYIFKRMVMHPDTGDLYIGAVNRIYRLSPELSEQSVAITGPKQDSAKCTAFSGDMSVCISPANQPMTRSDNYNKLLVIDKDNRKILTCGSIYQGTCEMRDLNNLSMTTSYYRTNDIDMTLAPNTPSDLYSVVSFISSGPICNSVGSATGSQNVLYIAKSNTHGLQAMSAIRKNIPSLSSHSLQNVILDNIFKDSFTGKEASKVLKEAFSGKESNLIQYKFGFATGGFSYFLTVQPEVDGGTKYISKLIQICQTDCQYHSYIEMPISCTHGPVTYNLIQGAKLVKPGSGLAADLGISTNDEVLIGIFSEQSQGYIPGSSSAVCVFTVKDIKAMIKDNMQTCFSGNSKLADQFKGTPTGQDCSNTGTPVTDNYCHTSTLNTPISGSKPLSRTAAKNYTGVNLTSIEVDVIDKYTVGFLGTNNGRMKRVLFRMKSYATEYKEDIIEDGVAILQDMSLSKDRNHIYVMTKNKVHRIAVTDCTSASTCQDCKTLENPYCGWCALQKKCSERRHCTNYALTKRWLSLEAWCIKLNMINPTSVSVAKTTNIEVTVSELPPLTSSTYKYQCIYGSDSYMTQATVSGQKVICPTPSPAPSIASGKDNVGVTLYIQSSETGVKFLENHVDFYDCNVHKSCSKCASSNWQCRWCIHDNKCVDSSTTCPHSDSTVVYQNPQSDCPRIEQIMENKIIPSGVREDIILKGKNLPVPKSDQSGYQCWVTIGNTVLKVAAVRKDSSTVECDPHIYESGTLGEVKAVVDIIWNGGYPIEKSTDNSTYTATVYKCSVLGPDCSSCLYLDTTHKSYNCKFCSNQCQYGPTCSEPVKVLCPPPDINNITPLSGPVEGGTLVTITGVNLGTNFAQVKHAVTIGDYNCTALESGYKVSTQIVCVTMRSSKVQNATVYVSLKRNNNNADNIPFSVPFQYKDPRPTSMTPLVGPVSGGTRVTIKGTQLNTGAKKLIKIGAMKCNVDSVTDTRIVCITESSQMALTDLNLRITFDTSQRVLSSSFTFSYQPDPTVTNIAPLKSYLAGGRQITVTGTGLNAIQNPKIFFKKDAKKYFGNCTVRSENALNCSSPAIEAIFQTGRKKRDAPGTYTVGFVMDGVQSVQNLDQNENMSSTVEVVVNPFVETFKDGLQKYKGDSTLELKGTSLNLAATKDEVTVFIGKELCRVETISQTRLYCKPPEKQPEGEGQGKLPKVKVTIGNLHFPIGDLEYGGQQDNEAWIISVAVGGGSLLTFIIIILVVYKRKSTKAERQYKKLKVQLDTLESNVRNECKQAFAELQTEVSDFTSDISIIGIPIWDYKTYTFKVLFPGYPDHPVMHNGPEYTNKFGGYDQGLHQFSQLLNSKHFMLIFIRTLEQQKNFGVRDKAVVASLLMIVLQDKMEYATDILRALMNELIDRSVEKKHPKLMLRRTESVVEKLLTNWLSVCMYSYLKKHAGKELFMLYQAIKRQTEKGPVDALSSEARYSLSEDRLLRDKIEPKTLTLNLVTDGEREPVTCKCLDCDTITQAKQKALDAIYLNTPFSQRPTVYDIDLEWRSGKSGHLPLQDEDVTTEVIHGWKKVNTLSHYHVPDGAVMALVQKRFKSDGVRTVHGRIEITGSNGMQPIVTMEEGQKVWHLLKHDDGVYISRQQKVISEIFLTRLLATKGTLQQYIDELFMAILRVDSNIPPGIKWLFDFLDGAARRHGIHDPDVVHTWKSNSLPLRFWVNIIKNPEFVFDIYKSNIADSCLSVIAQTFMDSCSTMEHRLGKDSPSNKLLFAKDIPRYRQWVSKFYRGIQEMAPVTDQDMNTIMTEMSLHYTADFNVSIALKELFKYAHQYNFELLEALDEDPSARKFHLANKFEEVTANLEGNY